MPEVSVVAAVYNVEKYLPKCIESLLAQTYRDFELILVNDGSRDSSPLICRQYAEKDSRILVIDQENGGLSAARNTGIAAAKGKYIQFIDSDDYVEPDLLERCVNKLEETDADMVVFDFRQAYLDGTGEVIRSPFDEERIYCLAEHPELLTDLKNAAWNKMYRTALFTETGIRYPMRKYYEDLGTTYRLIARCRRIAFLHEPLYNYLQDRPGNITHSFNRSVYDIMDMIDLTIDDYKDLGIYDTYYEELKYLGCVNILECLKKTRGVADVREAERFVDACFSYIKQRWPEYPACTRKLNREKYDFIYMNQTLLKLYLKYRNGRA